MALCEQPRVVVVFVIFGIFVVFVVVSKSIISIQRHQVELSDPSPYRTGADK